MKKVYIYHTDQVSRLPVIVNSAKSKQGQDIKHGGYNPNVNELSCMSERIKTDNTATNTMHCFILCTHRNTVQVVKWAINSNFIKTYLLSKFFKPFNNLTSLSKTVLFSLFLVYAIPINTNPNPFSVLHLPTNMFQAKVRIHW